MTFETLKVAVIVGSTRTGRFAPTVAEWVADRARTRPELDVSVVDLAQTWLPDVLDVDGPTPRAVGDLAPWLDDADAFVVVTPEYNHSFPAPVKTAIDWYYDEWAGKPVTFVAYGRESGGRHATAQLREIFAELNAVAIRNSVHLPCYWEQFAADGHWPKHTSELDESVRLLLDQLSWWANALHTARATNPFPV